MVDLCGGSLHKLGYSDEKAVRLAPKYSTDRSKSYCVIYTVKIDVYVKEGFAGNTNVAERKLGQRSFTHTVCLNKLKCD